MTIKGHSVRTLKEEFDLSDSRATGEFVIPDIGVEMARGLIMAEAVPACGCGCLSGDVIVSVAAVDFPVGVVMLSTVVSLSSREGSSSDIDPLMDDPGVGPAAKAGNEKFRWTAEGRVR